MSDEPLDEESLVPGLDWHLIPESDRVALNRFLRFGIPPGALLMANVQ